MSSVSRTAFSLLVIVCTTGSSFPVMASLRDYGIYLGSIGGSTSLRLDNRLRKNKTSEEKSNKLTSTTVISTEGFIWDPRFMTVDLSLRYSSSKREADTYNADANSIGFRFKSILFPRWRYPYLPIRLSASKTTSTLDSGGNGGVDTDYTQMALNWGLVQKQLGRVRMRYSYTLEESSGWVRERDTVRNRFQVNASKKFLKGKWGETSSKYGYQFDTFDDRVEDQFDMQHYLFMNNSTKFGKKADLSSNSLFYQRYYDGRDDGIDDEYVFASNANLRVQESERFQHYYSLGFRSDDYSNYYYGSAGANYSYTHDLDEYLKATASTGTVVRFGGGAAESSSMRFNVNANGRLAYRRSYDIYRLNAHYSMYVRSPAWGSGLRSAQSEVVRIGQSASLAVSRPKNPLYSDVAAIRAQYEMAEVDSYSYSADYSARSAYEFSNKASSLISGNARASQPSRGELSLGFGISAMLKYRFGRRVHASVNARQRWRKQEDRSFSLLGIKGLVSGRLYRRFNVKFSSALGWTRRIEEIQYNYSNPIDEIRGMAEVSSSMGKLVTSIRYSYSKTDYGGDLSSEQSIMLQIKRFFGWRL